MIISAAAPGRAVRRSRYRDSRFARLIVDQFLQPNAPVSDVAGNAKLPTYVTGGVDRDFMLARAPEGVAGGLEAEIELAFWRAAERSGRAKDYKAYLERYPNGFFVEFARKRLGLVGDRPTLPDVPRLNPALEAEKDLRLTRIQRRKIQGHLLALGFDPRGIDGVFGRGTRKALRRWQRSRGFDKSGYLDAQQLDQLARDGRAALAQQHRIEEEKRRIAEAADRRYWESSGARGTAQGLRAYLEKFPEGLFATKARAALAQIAEGEADEDARRERQMFRRARRADTAEAYRDYLGAYPDGIYRDQALARLDEIEGDERRQAERARHRAIERALGLSRADRISIEQRLRMLGFATGPQDGRFDRRTRTAITGYQTSRGLVETGFLNRRTVVSLVGETSADGGAADGREIDGADVIRGLLDALTK